ncbi:MAG: transposase [Myxococcales bacterium]|nr:transposase [Myxococcales bacterium]
MAVQQELPLPTTWGGKRARAGRPHGERASHHARPKFDKATPVHVTVRVRSHVWNLRSRRCHDRIGRCLEKIVDRFGLRVIEYAVLGNHIHFIVEADDAPSLARGIQGLSIRIAKSLNSLMNRTGAVFADHYHSRLLTSPTALVRAIAYVLRNHEHHYKTRGRDRFSSDGLSPEERRVQLVVPVSWLLTTGWRKASPADLHRLRGLAFGAP